jgi:phosphatidate cytidylyltransferase
MNNLVLRSITGAIFATVVLGSVLWDPFAQMAVFSIFMVLGLVEFYALFKNHSIVKVSKEIGLFIGLFIFTLMIGISLQWLPELSLVLIFPLFFTLILAELWTKKEHPLINISVLVFGIIYVVGPFYLTIDMNLRDDSYMPSVVAMFLLIWTNDTFAYLSGRLFGRTKLFERISPKKTWEGTIAGIIISVALVTKVLGTWIPIQEKYIFLMSVVAAIAGTFGDLFESKIKRMAGVKDSGSMMPGHGGFLDRFDSILFAVPFVWLVLQILF